MSFKLPKDWEKESDTLYVHTTLIRIQKTKYRDKDGWFLIPVDINEEVVGFDGTNEGRDKAFEQFEKDMEAKKAAKPPRKTRAKPKKKKVEEEPKEDEIDEGDED